MKTLRVVTANITLFGEALPTVEALKQREIHTVFAAIIAALDLKHLRYFAYTYRKLLVRFYPEMKEYHKACLDVYLQQELYADVLAFSEEIAREAGCELPYQPIVWAWEVMNKARLRKSITRLPHHRVYREGVIQTETLDYLAIDGNQYPEPEDVAKKNPYTVLAMLLQATKDMNAISDVLQQVTHYLFAAMDDMGLMTEAENQETKAEQALTEFFGMHDFDGGIVLLKGLINNESEYLDALNISIATAFCVYNASRDIGSDFLKPF